MDFLIHHAICFASHMGLLWLWHRARARLATFEQALLSPVYQMADFYLALKSILQQAVLGAGIIGIWLLFHKKALSSN